MLIIKRNELDLLLKEVGLGDAVYITDLCILADSTETISRYIRLSFTEGYIFICNNLNRYIYKIFKENF